MYISRTSLLHRRALLAAGFFFIYASFMTWPFLIHPLSTQTSAVYGDNFSSITKFDAIKFENKNPFVDGHLSSIAYPDGIKTNVGVDRVSFFSTLILYYGTLAANSIFAHGLFSFLGLFLSGFVMYLFVRKYVGGEKYAYLAGFLLISFPLMISLQRAAPVYMHMWLYVLPIWAFIGVAQAETVTKKNIVLLILSVVPGIFWTPYFTLHILIIFLSGMIFLTIRIFQKTGTIPFKLLCTLVASMLMICTSYYLIGHSSSYSSVPDRPLTDAYEQSLHPLMLVLPTADTWWSMPWYESAIQPIVPRAGEATLYIGASLVILALLGAWAISTNRTKKIKSRSAALFIAGLLITAIMFSLAPTIHIFGINIPTPNYFVVHAVPALRAGQRLLGIIALCVIVLAIIGIKWAVEHHYTIKHIRRSLRYAFFGLLSAVTILDIMPTPWRAHLSVVSHPESMRTLTNKHVVVAQYMNDSLIGYPGQLACKNYLIHHQTMVNSCGLDIDTKPGKWPVIESIARNDISTQLAQLKRLGVSRIIVDRTSIETTLYMTDHGIPVIRKDASFFVYRLD